MVDIREGILDAVTQGLCNTTLLSGGLAQLGSQLWSSAGVDGVSNAGQQLANGFGAAADIFCNREPRDISGEALAPFTGGQCSTTRYQCRYTETAPGIGSIVNTLSPAIFGPIRYQGLTLEQPGDVWTVTFTGGPIPPDYTGPPLPTELTGTRPNSVTQGQPVISNITIIPVGGPDDCGDPPPDVPAYDPSNFSPTVPVSYDDNNGNPQTFNVPIVFGPGGVGNGNEFEVPFTLEFSPNVQIDGSINLSTGDINIGFGGSDSGPVEIPEEDPIPEGSVLVGVRVIFTQSEAEKTPATERMYESSTETIWLPRLAAVRFEYAVGEIVGWSPSRFCQTLDSLIWAERPATNYDVAGEPGGEFTVRKIVMNPSIFFNGASGPGS